MTCLGGLNPTHPYVSTLQDVPHAIFCFQQSVHRNNHDLGMHSTTCCLRFTDTARVFGPEWQLPRSCQDCSNWRAHTAHCPMTTACRNLSSFQAHPGMPVTSSPVALPDRHATSSCYWSFQCSCACGGLACRLPYIANPAAVCAVHQA